MIAHDHALLHALTSLDVPEPWSAGPYWQPYARRIRAELARSDTLDGFRRNHALLKGFAIGGLPDPARPSNVAKRFVWNMLERGPVVRSWRKLAHAEHVHGVHTAIGHARLVLDRLADRWPFTVPAGLDAGDPEDAFEWRGQIVTAHFVDYLARAVDIRMALDRPVERLLEVGPGLGLSTLAWMTVEPALRVAVNVDLPEVLYLSARLLDVVGHRPQVATAPGRLHPQSGLHLLPPNRVPDLDGAFDLVCNAFSFQEMPRVTVEAYARELRRLRVEAFCLHYYPGGEWVPGVFGENWTSVGGVWMETFARPGYHAVLGPGPAAGVG